MKIAGEVQFEGVYCTLSIARPAPGIVVLRISGRDVGEFGDAPFQELAKDLANDSPIELFIDTRHAQGASIDVSNDWAQWLGKHRSHFRQISMLTGSRFIQLTADFVRRFAELGELMRLYTDAAAFDSALAQKLQPGQSLAIQTLARNLEAAQASGALSALAEQLNAILSQQDKQNRPTTAADWETIIIQASKAMGPNKS